MKKKEVSLHPQAAELQKRAKACIRAARALENIFWGLIPFAKELYDPARVTDRGKDEIVVQGLHRFAKESSRRNKTLQAAQRALFNFFMPPCDDMG